MRLMMGIGGNKKRGADRKTRVVLPKATAVDFANVPESTTSSKLAQTFPNMRMVKRFSTSRTTGSGKVEVEAKLKRVNPLAELFETKVTENRYGEEVELRAVEDRARLAARKGMKEMSKVRICLGMEEKNVELESGKAKLENKLVRLKSDLAREGKRLDFRKAAFGCHLLEMGYSKAEVNDTMAGTFVDEEEDEDDGAGVANVDRDDQYVNVHFKFVEATQTADDLTQKIEEKDTEISMGQKELAEMKDETTKLKRWNDALMVKSKEADMDRYRIQSFEATKKVFCHFLASLKD
ncbi:hypothetical protein GIB67_015408 [Kingdonia uniflora]|uniref:Uncharacterized protein n=1 Tax=Kingdonia uniflora TaxID=39325 RepID=A0A7J7KYV1_9MAGN|nr:hypothetical protein GIB67_015408 [Kingdonia uniflora]